MPFSIGQRRLIHLLEGNHASWPKSVKELWEKMSCYLSFSDKEVFKDVTPLEGIPTSLTEEAKSHSMTAIPAIASPEQVARETSQEPAKERKSPKFPRWEKVLHPSWPVVVTGQLPCPSRSQEQTYLLTANHNWHTRIRPTEAPSPMQELEVVQ